MNFTSDSSDWPYNWLAGERRIARKMMTTDDGDVFWMVDLLSVSQMSCYTAVPHLLLAIVVSSHLKFEATIEL